MKRFAVFAALAVVTSVTIVTGVIAQSKAPGIAVYKDPSCGCCAKWVEHLRQGGFAPTVTETAGVDEVKTRHRVPPQARSCHTALVGGYVIEGHVPAADIQRLLKERPAGVIGLAVPGMPIGSPGMEVAGVKAQAYDVLAFDKSSRTTVFASHGR